jgi:hypothetical protein
MLWCTVAGGGGGGGFLVELALALALAATAASGATATGSELVVAVAVPVADGIGAASGVTGVGGAPYGITMFSFGESHAPTVSATAAAPPQAIRAARLRRSCGTAGSFVSIASCASQNGHAVTSART